MIRAVIARSGPGVVACAMSTISAACSSEVSVSILPGDRLPGGDAGCAGEAACQTGKRALAFDGPYDRVEVASSPLLDVPQDFTIEAWVLVASYSEGHSVLNRWHHTAGDILLTFGTPEPLPASELPPRDPVPSHRLATWGYVVGARMWITAYSDMLPAIGQWHHLASSYGGGALKLYVDGVRWGMATGTDQIANPDSRWFIGATARSEQPIEGSLGEKWWPPIHGAIAEVRLSSTDRYPADFTPERRLASDPSTIALWHLDEGTGSTATDSGPSRLDGTIVGATWADVPSW